MIKGNCMYSTIRIAQGVFCVWSLGCFGQPIRGWTNADVIKGAAHLKFDWLLRKLK